MYALFKTTKTKINNIIKYYFNESVQINFRSF